MEYARGLLRKMSFYRTGDALRVGMPGPEPRSAGIRAAHKTVTAWTIECASFPFNEGSLLCIQASIHPPRLKEAKMSIIQIVDPMHPISSN